MNFIECKKYDFESTRPENFINLTMTVKNPFEKVPLAWHDIYINLIAFPQNMIRFTTIAWRKRFRYI